MKDTVSRRGRTSGTGGRPWRWLRRATLALWVAALGLWVQFAVASAEEMESQATALGWIVVAILLVGGLTVWATQLQTRHRRR